MTKKEVQQKMVEKIQAIKTLCNQLEINISAVQQVERGGVIRNVLEYTDTEKYDIEEEGLLAGKEGELPPLPEEEGVKIPVTIKE